MSQDLILVGGRVPHDLLDRTLQDPAEIVDGRGVERLVFPQLIDRRAGDMVLVNQRIR